MVEGNLDGIRKGDREQLEALVGARTPTFCDGGILAVVARISAQYNREIMLNISRGGEVLDITIGDDRSVSGGREGGRAGRLSGVRSVHTHPRGTAALSDLDYSCLRATRADGLGVAAIDGEGRILGCVTAYATPDGVEEVRTRTFDDAHLTARILEIDAAWRAVKKGSADNSAPEERAVLVGVGVTKESMEELAELARTAGAAVMRVLTQNIRPNTATVVGKGKLTEIAAAIQLDDANLVIFDNELSGSQAARLENILGVKVLDRSNLILDIFASRASSTEGKLQVELAQLEYNLPRLVGGCGVMDKMRSGIGMRGPGEKKLETDRRLIRERVTKLRAQIAKLTRERDLRRGKRKKSDVPSVALVGYTNAGKSTLMRALTRSDVYVADQLFATLDPLTRRVADGEHAYLLTDTVGFVSKLPHQFIDAFSSTLEEARLADLLLIVSDMSDPEQFAKREVVESTLARIGAADVPRLYVRNKSDRVIDPYFGYEPNSVIVSAATGERIDMLRRVILERLFPEDCADGDGRAE